MKQISCGGCYAVALGVDVIQQRPRRDVSPIPRVAIEKSSMFDDDRSFKRKDETPFVRKSQAINLRENRDITRSYPLFLEENNLVQYLQRKEYRKKRIHILERNLLWIGDSLKKRSVSLDLIS